ARTLAESAGRLFLAIPMDCEEAELRERLRAAALHAGSLAAAERLRQERETADRDLESLTGIGGALMQTTEHGALLDTILAEARRITASDAGSLYLVDEQRLRFRLTQNDSLPGLSQPDFAIPMDRASFAGYAATTGETLRIADAYALPGDAPYRFDRRFDEANGYRTRAVLAVPMCTPAGDTVGVLQLLNPAAGGFSERDQRLARALGGQAAVAIENQRLRGDIEALFEGFIRASVTALDQRDPGTSGHSVRVAELTCELARRADGNGSGPYAALRFDREALRELRYAALLHDFGKVFVPEAVLGKARKLPPERETLMRARFDQALEALEACFQRERARYLLECGETGFELFEKNLLRAHDAERQRLARFQDAIRHANQPRVLADEACSEVQRAAAHCVVGAEGREIRLLDEGDLAYLSIPKGSLTEEERRAIESHVTYTHGFLAQIPWTRDLARVETIASAHHEKLDGSGYPHGLCAPDIPVQARMLTIADIYDALTAADRPYKKALPLERALDILHQEADQGRIDADLLALFCAGSVWRVLDGSETRLP
ncbi:MAG: GAF domain-containing protein, partial [Myxococcales bacterium]|nr:GAF domain-containing protein [Myxococcales bacterium]